MAPWQYLARLAQTSSNALTPPRPVTVTIAFVGGFGSVSLQASFLRSFICCYRGGPRHMNTYRHTSVTFLLANAAESADLMSAYALNGYRNACFDMVKQR